MSTAPAPVVPAGNIVGRAGRNGTDGAPGLPGVNAVPADTAVGAYVGTDGTNSANSVDARIKRALPFITPEMYGAVGDGPTDDSAAILAMFAAAKTAGGANVIASKRYGVRGRIVQPGGVHVFGGGVRRVLATDDHKDRGLVALDNTFVYQYGAWGSGSIDDNPGKLDGLNIDGAGVGGATHLFEMQCVDGAIVDCRIVNSAGDAVELGGSQNSTFERCVIGYSAGAAWSCNQTGGQGAGQVKVNNSYLSDSAVLVKPTGDPAQFPSHDIFYTQCLFENHQIGDNIGSLLAGDMRFTRCTFTNSNSGVVPQDALVKISQDVYTAYSTTVEFNSCYWNGGANADKPAAAVWIKAASGGVGNIVVFTGHHQVTNCDAAIAVEGTTIANDIRDKASWYRGAGVAMYSTVPGGSLFGVVNKTSSPAVFSMPDDSSGSLRNPLAFRRDTDTGQINRLEFDRDGGMYVRDGAVSTVRASLVYSNSLSVWAMGGSWQFTNGLVRRIANLFTSGSGTALTLDGGSSGSSAYAVNFLLNGASANLTVSNGQDGSHMEITLFASTTTGNSVAWPSNVKWVGTAPQPIDNQVVNVEIVKDGVNWYGKSRSDGGGVSSGEPAITPGTTSQYWRGDKTWQTLDKAAVGLSNVPNVDTTNASNITTGTLPTSVLPPLAINETFTVASQAAMLALTAQRGDVAIRTDINTSFILSTDSPSTLADWKQILTPSSGVTSVNGNTGAVSVEPVVAAGSTSQYYRGDKTWQTLDKTAVGLGNVTNVAQQKAFVTATTSTAAATAAKTATVSGYTPAAGDYLELIVSNGNTVGAPTLNLNSAGAIGIYIGGAVADLTQVFSGTNDIWLLRYDGSRWNMVGAQSNFTQSTQAEMEAGTATSVRWLTALLVAQAIKAQTAILPATTTAVGTTFALADKGTQVQYTGSSAANFTIPKNSVVNFPVGAWFELCWAGSGAPTFIPVDGTVTLKPSGSTTLRAANSVARARYEGSDTWRITGDLA